MNIADWLLVTSPPLLIVSTAVLLRFRSPVLRWSVAALIPAAVALVIWAVGFVFWSPQTFMVVSIVAAATWGSFFGAALRPFGRRASLALVASVCVGFLAASALFLGEVLYFGANLRGLEREFFGTPPIK